jgi:hypothetical protein
MKLLYLRRIEGPIRDPCVVRGSTGFETGPGSCRLCGTGRAETVLLPVPKGHYRLEAWARNPSDSPGSQRWFVEIGAQTKTSATALACARSNASYDCRIYGPLNGDYTHLEIAADLTPSDRLEARIGNDDSDGCIQVDDVKLTRD